jgi:hypothetical protein
MSERCCASTFLRRPSTDRVTSTIVHREFIVARNLKQSSLVRCCCLRNMHGLLGWGQMLPGSGSFLMTPSKQALMRVNWNLMWSKHIYKCDLPCLYLWCENVLVIFPYYGGCHILASSRMVGCSPWWLPNPGWFQDVANKQAGYCRSGLCICNGR